MARKVSRTCIICRQSYSYCPQCGADAGKPTWYFIFDGQNCHDIYEVCTQYRDGEIDANKAYELISKLDLSNIEEFAESTRLQIEEILNLHKDVADVKVETQKESVNDANNTKFNKKR